MLSLPAPAPEDNEATLITLMERFTQDEGLTSPLTDEAATWLLRYAEGAVRRLIAQGLSPDQLSAEVSALRRRLRKAARIAGAESDPLAALQALLLDEATPAHKTDFRGGEEHEPTQR